MSNQADRGKGRKPPSRPPRRPPPIRWTTVRDIALFFGGMAGVFHETIVQQAERPTLLLMFAAMMGLPAFLRTDSRRREDDDKDDKDDKASSGNGHP